MEDIKSTLANIKITTKKTETSYNLLPLFYNRIKTKELLHSEIIADFLNPQGSHKCGDAFFQSFIKIIGPDIKNPELFQDVKIILELPIKIEVLKQNAKNEELEKTSTRFIDILITWRFGDALQAVIIENKLNDAPDQKDQLTDYYKAINNPPTCEVLKVVYMPLDHTKKKDDSDIEGLKKKGIVTNIYPEDLSKWLRETEIDINVHEAAKYNTLMYANLLDFINTEYELKMEAFKIQNELNLKDDELAKIIKLSELVKSEEWVKAKFETIRRKLNQSETLNRFIKDNNLPSEDLIVYEPPINKSNVVRIYFDSAYKQYGYWIEIWEHPDCFHLYLVTSKNGMIYKEGFEPGSIENDNQYFFNIDKDKYNYLYPNNEHFNRMITYIIELLESSKSN